MRLAAKKCGRACVSVQGEGCVRACVCGRERERSRCGHSRFAQPLPCVQEGLRKAGLMFNPGPRYNKEDGQGEDLGALGPHVRAIIGLLEMHLSYHTTPLSAWIPMCFEVRLRRVHSAG